MPRYGDEDQDRDYGHSVDRSTELLTPDAMRREVERLSQGNKAAISNINIETDKDGNAQLVGIKFPKELVPWLQAGLDAGKLFVVEKSHTVFDTVARGAQRLKLKGNAPKYIAAAAETGVRWGVIGIEQISEVVSASRRYTAQRRELYQMFAPVTQSTGADARNNEVMALAYKRANEAYWSDVKWLLTDIPRVAPMALLGWKEQGKAKERWKNWTPSSGGSIELNHVIEEAERKIEKTNKTLKAREELEDRLHKAREEWVDKEFAKRKGREFETQKRHYEATSHNQRKPYNDDHFRDYLRAQFDKAVSSLDHHLSIPDEKDDKLFNRLAYGGIGLSQILKINLSQRSEDRRREAHVPEMIEHLQKEIKNQCAQDEMGQCDFLSTPPENIRVTGMGNKSHDTMSLENYILDMFQQHERDRNPNAAFRDGKPVDLLGDALVEKLRPSIKLIAQALADGLDTNAMYEFIGGNQIINHGPSGELNFANEAQVKALIGKLKPSLNKVEDVTPEEFYHNFERPKDIQKTVKANLDELKELPKALFASLLPEGVLTQAGADKKIVKKLRGEAYERMGDFVAANILYLNEKGVDCLEKLGVSKKSIQIIEDVAHKINSGEMDGEALKQLAEGRNKTPVFDAIRNAGILQQVKGGESSYWSNRAGEMSGIGQKIEAARNHDADNVDKDKYRSKVERRGESIDMEDGYDKREFGSRNGIENKMDEDWSDRARPNGRLDSARGRLKESRDKPFESSVV